MACCAQFWRGPLRIIAQTFKGFQRRGAARG